MPLYYGNKLSKGGCWKISRWQGRRVCFTIIYICSSVDESAGPPSHGSQPELAPLLEGLQPLKLQASFQGDLDKS